MLQVPRSEISPQTPVFPLSSVPCCLFHSCLTGALLWTELIGWIHHNRWGHLQTAHLPSELLHLLVPQLSPPAEEVEMDALPRLHVKADQDAVRTGCMDEGCVHIAAREGEPASLQGDVE